MILIKKYFYTLFYLLSFVSKILSYILINIILDSDSSNYTKPDFPIWFQFQRNLDWINCRQLSILYTKQFSYILHKLGWTFTKSFQKGIRKWENCWTLKLFRLKHIFIKCTFWNEIFNLIIVFNSNMICLVRL